MSQTRGVDAATRARILARDGHACRLRLGGCTGIATTVDHVVPVAAGGPDRPDDDGLVAACRHCNSRKGARILARHTWYAPGWFA